MASARDRVLDAYETLLIEHGPGAATLDGVAAAATVSKGGLLYHFGSKDALVSGLLERLRERSAADADAIRSAPDGAVAHYVRTSAPDAALGAFTRTYLAVMRIADGTDDGRAVREALGVVADDAYEALREELDDPVSAWLAQLVGDGLYLRTLTGTPLPADVTVPDLLDRLSRVLSGPSPPPSARSPGPGSGGGAP